MHYRTQNPKLINLQLSFKEKWLQAFVNFSVHRLDNAVAGVEALLKVTEEFKAIETSQKDVDWFNALSSLIRSTLLLLQSYQNQLKGISGTDQHVGANLNAEQFLSFSQTLDPLRPSIQQLDNVARAIKEVSDFNGIPPIISTLSKTSLPVILTVSVNRYASFRGVRQEDKEENVTTKEDKTVLSALFFLDNELWANPQIVKPNHLYTLSGKLLLNHWPEGYDELILSPISTTNDDWYILSLPTVAKTDKREITVNGNIILKYEQSSMDPPISIKLLARFIKETKDRLFVSIIGYNQLILRVLGPGSFEFPIGFDKLNEKALAISQQIQTELKDIPKKELSDFLILLSRILNYQGYCLLHGIYKNKKDINEDAFRDELIKYLSADSRLASSLIKEGHIAGGRVEINFNSIIAELKVEKIISDRNKIAKMYGRQPAAYASAIGAQLSILCVLDLTEKINPPDIAAKNVFLTAPALHGFEDTTSTSRIAIVIIDGNTKNPSAYS